MGNRPAANREIADSYRAVLCAMWVRRYARASRWRSAQRATDKRTTSLSLRGLTRFTRLLRAVDVSRVRQFFEQLFNGYRWLDTLHQPFHPKVLAHFFQNEPKSECKRVNRKVRTCEISRFLVFFAQMLRFQKVLATEPDRLWNESCLLTGMSIRKNPL